MGTFSVSLVMLTKSLAGSTKAATSQTALLDSTKIEPLDESTAKQ